MIRADKRIALGVVSGARGVRGEVRIMTYTERPEDISAYGPLTDETGKRRFEIVSATAAKNGVVARIAGIDDRKAAEALKGLGLYVDRSALPQPEADSWYHCDLIGLAAEAPDGTKIGTVEAVQNFGAGDLLEIAFTGRRATELVPLTEAFVPVVDIAAGRVVVALPENFFEAGETEDADG
jgi:16S rRNA processing protein RimM